MKRELIVRRRMEAQAFHARDWYESQLEGAIGSIIILRS